MATLRLFASIREAAGTKTVEIAGATVGEIISAASEQFGSGFAELVPTCRIWLNGEPAVEADTITADDEVALLPPVSGG